MLILISARVEEVEEEESTMGGGGGGADWLGLEVRTAGLSIIGLH